MSTKAKPYLIVLGIAQDGGVPQAGAKTHRGWRNGAFRRHVVSLGIVDPETPRRWMIECTPDFREQLHMLDETAPVQDTPGLHGIFLTHAHLGHYTGLLHLGLEIMGAQRVKVHAMPRMCEYLKTNGPWSQLVHENHIELKGLRDRAFVRLSSGISITPFLVPHRQDYSETVGYRIRGPNRSVLFIPDIDSWEDWDEQGVHIEELISEADVVYLDGTFYTSNEISSRDMSCFPHPCIEQTIERLSLMSPEEREKVHFIHLNHTNPALIAQSKQRRAIEENGFRVAEEMERVDL